MVSSQNRAQKLLHYLADVAVNGSSIKGQIELLPKLKSNPSVPHLHDAQGNVINVTKSAPPSGWRQVLLEKGPAEFARQVRQFNGTLLMDTTWRDAINLYLQQESEPTIWLQSLQQPHMPLQVLSP